MGIFVWADRFVNSRGRQVGVALYLAADDGFGGAIQFGASCTTVSEAYQYALA